jgi:hypothetical protein
LREVHTIPIDSLSLFSSSLLILNPFGARRLSQQSYSCFPELRKGARPYIRTRGQPYSPECVEGKFSEVRGRALSSLCRWARRACAWSPTPGWRELIGWDTPSFEQPPSPEPFASVSDSGHPGAYVGYLIGCRESLPRVVIPHHPKAMRSTTTPLGANNTRTMRFRFRLWLVGWNLEFSSCVALMPRRETQGDESAMNLREGTTLKPIHRNACRGFLRTSPFGHSTNFAFTAFSEVRLIQPEWPGHKPW